MEYSPNIHQYSIDESFVDMTGTASLNSKISWPYDMGICQWNGCSDG